MNRGQVTNGFNSELFQGRVGALAHPPQRSHGKRMEEIELATSLHQMDAVGFGVF